MPSTKYWKEYISLGTPAAYRIHVQGKLDQKWSDTLAGMRITSQNMADKGTVTTLEGLVRDQAELVGVLNNLYELHLPILSVDVLNTSSEHGEEEG
jgi:hypothetical protein